MLDEVVPALSGLFDISGVQVTSVPEALEAINSYEPDAILLDIQLTEGGSEGVEIAKALQDRGYQGIVIGHSSFSIREQKKLLSPFGVKHFARKGSLSVLRCLSGSCSCGQEQTAVRGEAQGGVDLLIAMRNPGVDLALKRGLEDKYSVETVETNERAAQKILDSKPKVVIYESYVQIFDLYSGIVHDWGHLQAKDPELPEVADLNISWVMLSWGSKDEEAARERGHRYMRMPFSIAELSEVLAGILAR